MIQAPVRTLRDSLRPQNPREWPQDGLHRPGDGDITCRGHGLWGLTSEDTLEAPSSANSFSAVLSSPPRPRAGAMSLLRPRVDHMPWESLVGPTSESTLECPSSATPFLDVVSSARHRPAETWMARAARVSKKVEDIWNDCRPRATNFAEKPLEMN
jgi:hypothetical protein